MSIYKKVLGKQFYNLHPMLQKRYEMMGEQTFKARGVMKTIKGGPRILLPIMKLGIRRKLLFPEQGEEIPFTIVNTPREQGHQIHWERAFLFSNQTRYFNALMSLDSRRQVIEDYLGEPPLLYSDLVFEVVDGALTIKSSKQHLVLGKIEVPLPKWFQGQATVTEQFNDRTKQFEISVRVRNSIIGQLFAYEGAFTSDELT
ncbi:DUF4166 domain-containing protein [Tenuibacillus multivorans]|uniref:DUF4166 domain-containing protein n=1 Tax=Tenuibacillus multivorans TaxID=237069 RepID=A0A1H0AQH5_9BACI|nr:DUF4166 domain-containing protein [Tenuibacillus multivorans]GEL77860.1 hypothetical protein TMU01_20950 [Tenuibacillus multivorans]SDN35792.1 protein of unknown function [Tenuibacillus multivorans]